MDELIYTLKQQIIEALNLEDMKPEDIDENASLFGEGLGLDSIDALELIVMMEKNYGIKVSASRLAVFHPDYNRPYVVDVPYMKDEVIAVLRNQ